MSTRSRASIGSATLTQAADNANAYTTYAYDEASRLTTITPPAGSAATFTIDPLDRHATRTVGAVTDTYGYVGPTETAFETGTSGTRSLLDLDGSRLAVKNGSTVAWLVFDLHGSVAALCTAGTTTLSDAYRYDGWGQTIATAGTSANPWKYRGLLGIDPSAGSDKLYDMGARDYVPGLGTFTQLDTVAGSAVNPLTMNRFLYALANPATLIDPDGHFTECSTCYGGGTETDPNSGGGGGGGGDGGGDGAADPGGQRDQSRDDSMCDENCDDGGGGRSPGDFPSTIIIFPNGVFNPETTNCSATLDASAQWDCAQELLRLSGLYLTSHGCASIEIDCQVLDEEIQLLIQQAEGNGKTLWQEIADREQRRRENAFLYFMEPYVSGIALGAAAGGSATAGRYGGGAQANEAARFIGEARTYVEITTGRSVRNVGTNATPSEFAEALRNGGWTTRLSSDGRVVIFEKDGATYVLRDRADSYSGWTADFYVPGSSTIALKLRLGYNP